MKKEKKYWLLKTEAEAFSIEDLKRVKKEPWSGVRNFQARNFILQMQVGDMCLIYHTGSEKSVVGLASVASNPHPDPTQFDKAGHYFEPKATPQKPLWFLVDVSFVKKFKRPVTLAEIKHDPTLRAMYLTRAPRLSVQPVSEKHFNYILKLESAYDARRFF